MTEQECLSKMIAPGQVRPCKPYRNGVIQVHVTRACDKACVNCTQGSNFRGPYPHMTAENFRAAVASLKTYWGVIGLFGGNPAVSPLFAEYCQILRESGMPREQLGIWSNNPMSVENAREMSRTFNPGYSNLNVHLDREAYAMFKRGWPECNPVGLSQDSHHSPVFVSMRDALRKDCPACEGTGAADFEVATESKDHTCDLCGGSGKVHDESKAWELISNCDINQRWSAMLGQFRGQLRAWFCEIAGAQSILHQDDPKYPDTGIPVGSDGLSALERWRGGIVGRGLWWEQPMSVFADQVRKHCHECGVPLRARGELSQSGGAETASETHAAVCRPKRKDRQVKIVTDLAQLGTERLARTTDYFGNARVP